MDELSGYPWELLEDRSGSGDKPLSVAAGMLRQLKTSEFRAAGAQQEALAVAECLEQYGFIAAPQIHSHASDILVGLHGEGYRVLHTPRRRCIQNGRFYVLIQAIAFSKLIPPQEE